MDAMKHVFVVNPTAGRGVDGKIIERMVQQLKLDYEVYTTKCKGDTERFVKERAAVGDRVRFYACGGDGTMRDVAQGLLGFENASMTVYPVGSGNDFVRAFGGKERFLNLAKLTAAEEIVIDAITVNDKYVCLNACHFGFDSAVAAMMNQVKQRVLIGGKNAYTTGVVKALVCNMKTTARITVDGEVICKDAFLLCSLCNGTHVGGGYRCAPRSLQDDGMLEVCLVRPISRLKFVNLMNTYREGGHLDDPRFKDVIVYRQSKEIEIQAGPGFTVSLDGEIFEAEKLTVKAIPGAVRFAVPEE